MAVIVKKQSSAATQDRNQIVRRLRALTMSDDQNVANIAALGLYNVCRAAALDANARGWGHPDPDPTDAEAEVLETLRESDILGDDETPKRSTYNYYGMSFRGYFRGDEFFGALIGNVFVGMHEDEIIIVK